MANPTPESEVIRLTNLITWHNAAMRSRCGKLNDDLILKCVYRLNPYRNCSECPANHVIDGVEPIASPAEEEIA